MRKKLFKDWKQSIDAFDLSLRKAAPQIQSPNYLLALKEDAPAQKIDDSLFQHILGDYWGGQTGLEGYGSLEMLQYLIQIFNLQIQALDANPLCTDVERSELCQIVTGIKSDNPALYSKIRDLFQGGVAFASELQSSKELQPNLKLQKQLDAMTPGQNLMFMGGWENKDQGHALVYEIEKQKDHHFTVRIFNRGAGLEYHAEGLIEEQTRSTPFWEVSNVALDRLVSPIFSLGVQELDRPPVEGKPWEGSDIYEALISDLQGTVVLQSQSYDPKTALETLKVGHCTFLSLTGLLQRIMGKHYKRYTLDLQFKTLWDYYSQQKTALADNHFQRKFLKKGSAQLAKNGNALFDERLIRVEELTVITKALEEINEAIKKAETNPTILPKSIGINVPLPLPKKSLEEIKTFDFNSVQDSQPFNLIDVAPFNPASKNFADYCKDWQNTFASMNRNANNYPIVKEAIKDWVRKIPISWIENPATIKTLIPSPSAEDVLDSIAAVAREFWLASHQLKQHEDRDDIKLVEPIDFFTGIKLLTLGDAIGRATEIAGGNLDGLYQIQMDLLLDSTSGSALLFDPELEDHTASIKAYWDRLEPPGARAKRNHLSFFGVEAMHLGSRGNREIENSSIRRETFPWSDLMWAENYLKRSEIQEMIRQENPRLAFQPLLFQAMASLAELETSWSDDPFIKNIKDQLYYIRRNKTKFLPIAFYALRQLSKVLDWVAHPQKYHFTIKLS